MGPDLTAVGAAYGRALHVILDDLPYVFEDMTSIKLADDRTLQAARLAGSDGRLAILPDDPRARARGSFVGRARFVEDLVSARLAKGVVQYVILGAGLDTFGQRRGDLVSRLHVFEVDTPRTQQWKRQRIRDLSLVVPENLSYVPVDFESGDSWVEAISRSGFDIRRPAIIASTGVSQYISVDAMMKTLREAAQLAPGTTFVCTSLLPIELVTDPVWKEVRTLTAAGAASRGAPWISFYTPEQFMALAQTAGFDDVRDATAEVNERHFASRKDGLRCFETIMSASRR